MVHVLATIRLNSGRRADFLEQFHRLVPLVQAEDGCLEYGPAVDMDSGLDAQEPIVPDVVTVIEKWASLEALKAHLAAPHMDEYRERVAGMVQSVSLRILEPA